MAIGTPDDDGPAETGPAGTPGADPPSLAGWRPTLDPAKLRARRRQLGLTGSELGARVGKLAGYVSDLENGRRLKNTPLGIVARLAYALGLGVEELMTDPPAWAAGFRAAARRRAGPPDRPHGEDRR